ncbi:glutamate decarboxylase [Alteromonas australica]|uniref:Glutamate decarboxylase n=1 Tax=Alteromonas australica TaxID=589873 RepID=A0A075P054_9ALTE|nr:putative pyridoxal-dependent aspartate 1-decarboxylase [Alteromonas australica]MBU33262.1 putative pyridoxal-dependent aspartate 1-decarboxylase [Alteromonas sp.]AIG00265.1 glutamate decarboxylase [Alteromonas australica]AJP45222.1 glutamate decarboxylase [Alteromonas australica]HBF73082.1 putative pyridoxal-dependent aspartate 1-decarboxylase [Alteromonas australica]HBU49775.1 putative pyridoxal-dependent aspartate 1-decarboxylase [Alteromonas australica]
MGEAQVSLEHLFRVFTKPEHKDSKLAQIEQHLSDNILDFLSQHVVTKKTSLEEVEKDFANAKVPESPEFVSTHAETLLDKLVAHSVNTYSPTFIGHMTSALPYFHLPLSKLMVGLNQNLVKIETSKAFTPLERQVLGMLHNLVYDRSEAFYEQHLHSAQHALGAFCSGGTIANITALWVARNKLLGPQPGFAGVAKAGLAAAYRFHNINHLGVMCSKRGHYSLSKAVDALGLGREQLIALPAPQQTLDPEKALRAGKRYQEEGNKLLAIVGVGGTTETGHVDPLDELADVAEQLGCWFHVDAAWGGATLFSSQYRDRLKGIERADSVTIDAHKQMYVPMGAGMALFKDPENANAVRHHAQYILRAGSKDLGATTLEGSRNGMAMMVYSALHIFGRRGYELLIDRSIQKAKAFADMIDKHPDFELTTSPTLSLLTYRVCPQALQHTLKQVDDSTRDEINEKIDTLVVSVQKQQREAGKSFVSRTRLEAPDYPAKCITVFRVVLANPLTSHNDLAAILAEQHLLATSTPLWQSLSQLAAQDPA